MDHEEATTARLRMRDAKTKGDSSVGDTRSVFGQKVAGMFKCVFERMIVLPNQYKYRRPLVRLD
jgi:hypothetical protein